MTTGTVGYLAFLLLAIYLFLRYVMGYVMPFVIGVALALLLEPVVKFFTQRFRLIRAAAAALTVLGLIAILALILSWGITRIAAELTDLYRGLPDYYMDFNAVLSEVLRIAGDISSQIPEPLARVAQEQWNRIYSLLSVIVTGAGGVFWGVPGFAVTAIFTLLSTYFAMRDRAAIGAFVRSVVPGGAFRSLKSIERDILGGIVGFIRAQALLVTLTMIANVIGLTLLGSRYAVALGLLCLYWTSFRLWDRGFSTCRGSSTIWSGAKQVLRWGSSSCTGSFRRSGRWHRPIWSGANSVFTPW